MEAIGTLAGGIAHDFNNILSIILGYSEMAQLDVSDKDKLSTYLLNITVAADRAKELVKQILSFCRCNEEERNPLRVNLIVREALKLLRAAIPSTIEIRQKIEVNPGDDTILADPTQIHQVLMNLCTNAEHAMREKGGILDVGLTSVEIGQEKLSGDFKLKPGPYIRLTVSDTGRGMDRTVLERVFEPYFTTKDLGEGTGLGLSIVHGIVNSHGGGITVYSESGEGATFSVYLPKLREEFKTEVQVSTSLPRGSERVLMVDDEKKLADLGKDILEYLGYMVTMTTSSIEALGIFKAQPDKFDLIISDQTMPQMTGLELSREILRISPGMPIILCTGFSAIATQERSKAAGIRELLMKPLVMRDVAFTIRRVLDEKQSH
jgi:CheY-like chemotaxis protein